MEEENMILRDLPVNTRNYTILDNVTGKPIDQNSYSLTIDKEVISKLNKLKQVNEEKRRQASLKGQYADITIVDTFTPNDNAVFTPIYSGDFNEAEPIIQEDVKEPEEEKVSELIKQEGLLERVVARDPIPVQEEIEDGENTENGESETSFNQPIDTPQANENIAPQNDLYSASEQIINIEAEKLGKGIKPPKGFKEGKEVISLDKMEVKEGKGFAWMAYILFFIPLLFNKTNRFVRLHANIGLELNILEILSVILIAPKLLLTTLTGTLATVVTIASLVGIVLLASCAITLIPMILGAMFGKYYQRPWLFRKRLIKVATTRA